MRGSQSNEKMNVIGRASNGLGNSIDILYDATKIGVENGEGLIFLPSLDFSYA